MAKDLQTIEKSARILTDDPETALKELREITKEETFRLESEKYRYYEPNGKCADFIVKVGEGGNFVVLFSAANGVGKTASGANVVAHLIWGDKSKNPYFDMPMFKNFPFPKRGRIASDPTNISKNLIPTLKEWLPAGKYKTKRGDKHFESIWTCDNGWEFDIMSYEQDVKEFESSTLGWAWFDEPPPQAVFKATVARMRKGGIIFITETPLYAAWLYDHVIANPDQELAQKGQRVYVEASVEDACKEHGIRGHLEHEHIQTMIAEYTEDEKQARVYGKFQHLVGLRFKSFDRKIHVIRPFEITRREWSVYHALDTHPRNPDAGIWIAVDAKGRKIVVDEYYEKSQGGVEEMAQRIKDRNDKYRIERKLLEPAAFIEDQHTDKSLATRLASFGLNYLKATKSRSASDKRIEDALSYQQVNLSGQPEFIKAPELFIFDICHRTIFEFEHLRWDEWEGKTTERKDQKETTMDKDDHTIECIGRILYQEPVFVRIEREDFGADNTKNYDPYGKVGD